MFSSSQQISFHAPLDPSMLRSRESSDQTKNDSHTEFYLFKVKKLKYDIIAIVDKIKKHKDNLEFFESQRIKLDGSIQDYQVCLSKLTQNRNSDINNHQGVYINENSAAGVLESLHGTHASQLTFMNDVVGVVAKLGKLVDENLSQILSDYLGTRSMLAIVCKNYDTVKALVNYDNHDNIVKSNGLYGLASSIGKSIEGDFDIICLEHLRPYVGHYVADDPQRKLDLPKPKLSNGNVPTGFLGFAVNMIQINPAYLVCLTSYGYGLRETLFYTLFSCLQVYKTRGDMINALSCISDGAVSLDGGIIKRGGTFTVGSRNEVDIRFAKPIYSRAMVNYSGIEKQMNKLKWKREKMVEDIIREQVLYNRAVVTYQKKKEEYDRFTNQVVE